MPSLRITHGTWEESQRAAKMIREQVFIQEQNIAAEYEWDEQDEIAVHFVVYEQDQVIATARLLQNRYIKITEIKLSVITLSIQQVYYAMLRLRREC